METQSIAKNLLYQRKLKGYTQEELSEKTQVTIRSIQRIEKGDVNPHLQTVKLVVLEKILGKKLVDLAQEIIFNLINMHRTSYQWSQAFEKNFAYGHTTLGKKYAKDIDNEPRAGSTLETTSEDYIKFLEAVLQNKIISKKSWNEIFKPQIGIRSVKQFGPLALKDSTLNDAIELSYGLGWGILQTPYGIGVFKEGHSNGFQHYSILFPEAKKGIMIMTNSDNGESIFEELLEITLNDIYTPSEWENYISYKQK